MAGTFDEDAEQEAMNGREVLFGLVDQDENSLETQTSCFSAEELADIASLRQGLRGIDLPEGHVTFKTELPSSAWGDPACRGRGNNSWDDIDATTYRVRGATYLEDHLKVYSAAAIGELVLVDMFETTADIPCVTSCAAAGTLQRLRDGGEERRLVVMNIRAVPLVVVGVWALPSVDSVGGKGETDALFARFVSGDMSDAEKQKRLKVIPRVVEGPWIVRRALGKENPAILGKVIPLLFYRSEDVLEISVGVFASTTARQIYRILRYAVNSLNLELALVLEGTDPFDLPEQIFGGFRISCPDLSTLRVVNP
eukprot:TRINITY_DN17927_c0_g1_i1.p1 TRINITY_DN17927_c0_g1~~TRINITY_DN17927_c0_g1_i1.p1  ORF type:complete len:311 (-),score=37.43 TRINITY_DN17927_c0_g1_i1:534-1466(-)